MHTPKPEPIGGILAQTITAAITAWHAQKEAGATLDERTANLERTLRISWPRRRAEPWHFLCDRCQDTGWSLRDCPGTVCGRSKPHHSPHSYVIACLCAKGGAVRALLAAQASRGGVEEAGHSQRMTRVGR